MHKTASEVAVFTQILRDVAAQYPGVQLFIIPPFTSLGSLAGIQRPESLWIGAQNMHWADAGAYTGEISAAMLQDLGVDLVMLGHAERRHSFGETDQALNQKVHNALRHGLRVLLCEVMWVWVPVGVVAGGVLAVRARNATPPPPAPCHLIIWIRT